MCSLRPRPLPCSQFHRKSNISTFSLPRDDRRFVKTSTILENTRSDCADVASIVKTFRETAAAIGKFMQLFLRQGRGSFNTCFLVIFAHGRVVEDHGRNSPIRGHLRF